MLPCAPHPLASLARPLVTATLVAVGAVASARADESCTLHLAPAGADPAWRDAAADAQRAIDETAPAARDCRRIDVTLDAQGAGAALTFVTRDGRTATRHLRASSELRPVVEGLLVTFPMSPASGAAAASAPAPASAPASGAAAASAPASASAPAAASAAAPDAAPAAAAGTGLADARGSGLAKGPVAAPAHVLLSGEAGVRLGLSRAFLGPAFGLAGAFTLAGWELGVLGLWEPANFELSSKAPSGSRISALGAGVRAGRRERFGAAYLYYAAQLVIVSDTLVADSVTAPATSDPRFGVLAGLAWPRASSQRIRLQLGFDYNPYRRGQLLGSGLPRWGIGLMVGFETEAL
jgi:hypothetical protein